MPIRLERLFVVGCSDLGVVEALVGKVYVAEGVQVDEDLNECFERHLIL